MAACNAIKIPRNWIQCLESPFWTARCVDVMMRMCQIARRCGKRTARTPNQEWIPMVGRRVSIQSVRNRLVSIFIQNSLLHVPLLFRKWNWLWRTSAAIWIIICTSKISKITSCCQHLSSGCTIVESNRTKLLHT